MRRRIVEMLLVSLLPAVGALGTSLADSAPKSDEQNSEVAPSPGQPSPRSRSEPPAELKPEQEEAIAELKKLGCRFPERPVVSLTLRGRVTDADLVHLKGLPNLRELRFEETRVSNAGLVHLKDLPGLQTLELAGCRIQKKLTGKGLVHLKDLKSLRSLRLAWIPVNDADLEHVKVLTSLKSLGLCGSGPLTDAGVEHL